MKKEPAKFLLCCLACLVQACDSTFSAPALADEKGAFAEPAVEKSEQPANPAPGAQAGIQSQPQPQERASPEPARAVEPSSPQAHAPAPKVSPPASQAGSHSQSAAPRKPVTLFGRIEEIATSANPQLPVKLRALVPKLDTSRQTVKGSAQASSLLGEIQGSFPVDWRGVWGGALKVWSTTYSPLRIQFDPKEASREQQLLQKGTTGNVTFTIGTDQYNRLSLQPAQVVFTAQMDSSQAQDMLNRMTGGQMGGGQGLEQMLGGQAFSQLMRSVPYMYALHLGDLASGVGVTGNLMQARVLKNTINELAGGVLEQTVVTYDATQNRTTGRWQTGYSENVVRFTRQSSDQLYVQAVTVSYSQDGKFLDRVVLYGTVNRGQSGGGGSGGQMPDPLGGLLKMLSQ